MADKSMLRVEVEFEQIGVDASLTPQIQVIADWVAMQVFAYHDPRAMHLRVKEIAHALDRLQFGYIFGDSIELRDRLATHIVSAVNSSAKVSEAIRVFQEAAISDKAGAQDAIRSAVATALISEARIADTLSAAWQAFETDRLQVTEKLMAGIQTGAADAARPSDQGVFTLYNYDIDYVERGYVAEISSF